MAAHHKSSVNSGLFDHENDQTQDKSGINNRFNTIKTQIKQDCRLRGPADRSKGLRSAHRNGILIAGTSALEVEHPSY